MLSTIIPLALALVGQVAGQTVYLTGDSTTAPGGGGKGTEGKKTFLALISTRYKNQTNIYFSQAGANTCTTR